MTTFVLTLFFLGLSPFLLPSWPSFRVRRFRVGGEGKRLCGIQTGYKHMVDWVIILPPCRFEIYPVTDCRWGGWKILPKKNATGIERQSLKAAREKIYPSGIVQYGKIEVKND